MSGHSRVKTAIANQVIDECESTNDLARPLAEQGAPHGTWVSTRRQGAGRGRLGRKWESIDGNLFLSLIVRIAPVTLWSWVPLATAVAVAECLRDFNPKLEIEIKWPNDLWIDRRKLGGILCEASSSATESFIVIGLGLNCVRAPQGLDQQATSLTEFLGLQVTADEVRTPLIAAILSVLDDLERKDPMALLHRYEKVAALKRGMPIEWKNGEIVSMGNIEGVGTAGELIVRTSGGTLTRLYAEDVKVRATGT